MSALTSVFQSCEKLCFSLTPLFKLYQRIYYKVLEKEILLGGFSRNDIILNIGCGAVPFTAVHLTKLTGAKVIAVDKDQEALEKAEHIISKLGLSQQIELVSGDASFDVPTPFTGALVALQAEPKIEILETLKLQGNTGSRLIFRQPREAFKSQYDYLPEPYLPDSEVIHWMKTMDKSILFIE